jgi:hypothetical protein
MKKILVFLWMSTSLLFSAPDVLAQQDVPTSFTIDDQGSLTCNGIAEDACAYYDEIQTPSGTLYLVQGSVSRHPDNLDSRKGSTDYFNVYFALLCEKNGNTLTPSFNFLEGREKVSDLHLHDLDGDGVMEIFKRRANTPNTDFEIRDGVPVVMMQQRAVNPNGSLGAVRQKIYRWNGKNFVVRR